MSAATEPAGTEETVVSAPEPAGTEETVVIAPEPEETKGTGDDKSGTSGKLPVSSSKPRYMKKNDKGSKPKYQK